VQVEQMVLFGSHASGTARDDSDIDVAVISSTFTGKDYWERIDILSNAIYALFAPIEAIAFSPEEWQEGNSLIAQYARKGLPVT
ncbi:MAG: nucleotidyltransferase domain-containing protein, partial [Anaerolineae bacterium]